MFCEFVCGHAHSVRLPEVWGVESCGAGAFDSIACLVAKIASNAATANGDKMIASIALNLGLVGM